MKSCKHTLQRKHVSLFSVSYFYVVHSLIHSLNKYFWVSLIARHYSWPLNVVLCKTDDVDGCGVDEETTPGPLECSNKPSPSHYPFQNQKQNQNPSHNCQERKMQTGQRNPTTTDIQNINMNYQYLKSKWFLHSLSVFWLSWLSEALGTCALFLLSWSYIWMACSPGPATPHCRLRPDHLSHSLLTLIGIWICVSWFRESPRQGKWAEPGNLLTVLFL